jgi:hypothetical protein
MLVRPIERDDFEAWLPLWDGYNAFYGRAGATALPQAITRPTCASWSTRTKAERAFTYYQNYEV